MFASRDFHRALRAVTALTYSTVVNTQDSTLEQYPSLNCMNCIDGMPLDANGAAKKTFRVGGIDRPIQQLLGYETGFVALTADGMVYTWGDERYALCLGRPVSPER
jgi:hypothetical protein